MKNKITYLITLLFILSMNSIFAQNVPIDFEAGGNGAAWTWSVFENDTNPALEIIPNPDASGINASATVAKFTALQTGNPWAGVESMHGSDLGTFTLDATNAIVKIMVWKPVVSDVGIKFILPSGEALPEIKVPNTLINQWEELTFDFSGRIDHPATIGQDQIAIFPDFNLDGRAQDNICYFDNITFSEISQAPQPTVAAPTPTVPSENVTSLFSNAYTDVPVDTWLTGWSSAVLSDIQIQGNDTKLYTTLDFAGIETVANPIDATDMDFFHIDVWSPNATPFRVKLVDLGAGVEGEIAFNIAQEEWVSLEIPLDNFADPTLVTDPAKLLTVRSSLQQLIISGLPAGAVTAYIDNVYLYKSTARLQVIHNAADVAADPVVVYLNGDTLLSSFAFREATPFIDAPAGVPIDIGIGLPGGTVNDTLKNFTVTLADGETYIAFANGVTAPGSYAANPDGRSTEFGLFINAVARETGTSSDVDFFVLHGATDAPTVDVIARGVATLVDDAAYGDITPYITVPPAAYTLDLTLADGTSLVQSYTADLSTLGGGSAAVFASGFLTPSANQNGEAFGIFFALADGTVGQFPETATDISEINEVPVKYSLDQNYPNPFNPTTKITFSLLEANNVSLKVYNMLGEEIATLVNGFMNAGTFEVAFDATDLPTGTYFYSITAGNFKSVKKMMLIK
jgi:hypothetical protein